MRIDYPEYWWNSKIKIKSVRLYSADNNLGDVEIPPTVWYTANSPYVNDTEHFVSSVWDKAFKGRVGISSVSVPTGITYIGSECFMNCVDLESVIFNNALPFLPFSTFKGCSKLSKVRFQGGKSETSSGIFSIGGEAFEDCLNLRKFNVPHYCELIEQNAFNGCSNLQVIYLGDSVKLIRNNAFNGCNSLMKIVSSNKVPPQIEANTFMEDTYTSATLYVPIGSKDAYTSSPYWCRFFNIEETNELEDVSENKEKANAICGEATNIYNSFINYHNGEAHNEYVAALTLQSNNVRNANYGLSVIDSLKNSISESALSEESKQSNKETLDRIGNEINTLLVRNNQHELSLIDVVNEHLDMFNAYNERLAQYKEQIETATTNDELETVICIINADIKDMQDNHLKPIEDNYTEMLEFIPTLTEVEDGLKSCLERIDELKTEIGTKIDEANESLAEKKEEVQSAYQKANSLYQSYLFYYDGGGMEFYNQVLEEQAYNDKMAADILYDIDVLYKRIADSSLSDEEKTSYDKLLEEIENTVYGLRKENDGFNYTLSTFIETLQEQSDAMNSYYERLTQYKERIDAASTKDELDAVMVEMNQDRADTEENFVKTVVESYHEVVIAEGQIYQIGLKLATYKQQLKEITEEVERLITSGIKTVIMSDGDVIVVNLRGERMAIKSTQIKTLPKGIYIINGKKHVLK